MSHLIAVTMASCALCVLFLGAAVAADELPEEILLQQIEAKVALGKAEGGDIDAGFVAFDIPLAAMRQFQDLEAIGAWALLHMHVDWFTAPVYARTARDRMQELGVLQTGTPKSQEYYLRLKRDKRLDGTMPDIIQRQKQVLLAFLEQGGAANESVQKVQDRLNRIGSEGSFLSLLHGASERIIGAKREYQEKYRLNPRSIATARAKTRYDDAVGALNQLKNEKAALQLELKRLRKGKPASKWRYADVLNKKQAILKDLDQFMPKTPAVEDAPVE